MVNVVVEVQGRVYQMELHQFDFVDWIKVRIGEAVMEGRYLTPEQWEGVKDIYKMSMLHLARNGMVMNNYNGVIDFNIHQGERLIMIPSRPVCDRTVGLK